MVMIKEKEYRLEYVVNRNGPFPEPRYFDDKDEAYDAYEAVCLEWATKASRKDIGLIEIQLWQGGLLTIAQMTIKTKGVKGYHDRIRATKVRE